MPSASRDSRNTSATGAITTHRPPGREHQSATRIQILGVPVDAIHMATALARVRAAIATHQACTILAVNPEKVIAAQRNPALLRILWRSGLLVPDGIGVVVAARLLGRGPLERVPGSELMPGICGLAAAEGYKVFLYGAKPGIAQRAGRVLRERYPGLDIVGVQHGYRPAEDMDGLVDEINASGADILFVALGSPKQELWLERYRERLAVSVRQGVGGSFDAICGNPPRAPLLFRKCNLEWLYRLISQPARAHRQSALPLFALQLLRQLLWREKSSP